MRVRSEPRLQAAGSVASGRLTACVQEALFDPNLKVEQMAARLNMSRFQFCRLFRRHIGVSFREYVACQRVEVAKRMLRARDVSVTEVCFAIGYNDLTHFGRVFRKVTGLTPSGYRELAWRTDEKLAGGSQ